MTGCDPEERFQCPICQLYFVKEVEMVVHYDSHRQLKEGES